MDLSIDTTHDGPVVRLRLHGEIDMATTGLVHDAVIAALTSDSVREVLLDFADLTFIDSSGMGTLVACQRAIAVRDGTLRLQNLSPFVRRQLFAAGLLGLLGAEDDPQAVATE
ncbi:STAS domain-containing protein [Micromonospora sp. WMMD1155]|uniref:STAS domain-containing protein n=1 Tax=Micromonospora sp. WMMD1155 TaxID=3016094 RepID=UPI00249A0724|nr:STAS domain-containing protein [Micromonospora sp. WMMD1155]WFE53227.1 STAS domain-containing protein [Micromonospora sp. WMMD1155]